MRTSPGSRIRLPWTPAAAAVLVGTAALAQASGPQTLNLRVYEDEFPQDIYLNLWTGYNQPAVPVCSLVPDDPCSTIGDLIAGSWDFSGVTSGQVVFTIQTPVDAENTCYASNCGFNRATNDYLIRQDDMGDGSKDVSAVENDGSGTIWLRAAALDEGIQGETRLCFDPDAAGRPEVQEIRFPNPDGTRRYTAKGDTYQSSQFNCDLVLWQNGQCDPNGSQTYGIGDHEHVGRSNHEVLDEGVLVLPSGHRLNALLIRNTVDVALFLDSPCSINAGAGLRQHRYAWVVPHLGGLLTLASEEEVPTSEGPAGWSIAESTMIGYGLLPTLSTTITDEDDTRVTISWDPGRITIDIDRHKVYWDTDSGASSTYAFNSDTHSDQVTFNGTSATVSGLSTEQTYFFTVTALKGYTAPGSTTFVEYESLLFPKQVFGNPSDSYPQEVTATTLPPGCTPAAEVEGLVLNKVGAEIETCWDPVSDPCHDHYRLLGSDEPSTGEGWNSVGETAATCLQATGSFGHYLVISEGTGDEQGPWGHYGK